MARKAMKVGMQPPHPGTFIRTEVLEPLALSITAAARILHVRRSTLSDLVNGHARLSPEMAFGLAMNQMLEMQTWHDVHAMRSKEHEIAVERYRA